MDVFKLLRTAMANMDKFRWFLPQGDLRMTKIMSTKMKDSPIQVAIEIKDNLNIIQSQTLNATYQEWHRIVTNMFETVICLNSENAEAFSKYQVTITVKKIGDPTGPLLAASCFPTHIHKLELKDVWCTTTGFKILEPMVSLQELILNYTRSGNHYLVLDVGEVERRGAKELEERGVVVTWLPSLTKLSVQAEDCHKEFLRLIALIVRRGQLTSLKTGLEFFEPSNCLADTSLAKKLMLDFILQEEVVGPSLAPDLSIHGLIWKILNWNRNSLFQIGFHPSYDEPDPLFDANTSHYQICLEDNRISQKPTVERIRSYSGWIYAEDLEIVQGDELMFDFENWNGSQDRVSLCQTLRKLNKLQTLKLSFFPHLEYAEKAREAERLPVHMILRNAATLTTIFLEFIASNEFFTDETFVNTDYAGVFSKCVSLKNLVVKVLEIFDDDREKSTQPKFRGIDKLPESLTYFRTTFPIIIGHQSLANLETPNLGRLETLCLTGFTPCFILQDTEITQLDFVHLQQLKAKMPKLNTMVVYIGYSADWIEKEKSEGTASVSAEIFERFELGLKSMPHNGIVLEIDMSKV